MPADWAGAELVLVGLGASRDRRTAATVRAHAAAIGRRGLFAAVRAAFLRQPPPPAETVASTAAAIVYVVPCLIGDSHLARDLVPAALGLGGTSRTKDGRTVRYCDPIGASPRLTDLVRARAQTICREQGLDPARATLLAVGHGAPRDAESTATVRRHVEALAAAGGFGQVLAAFLEEPPSIADQVAAATTSDIVAVGMFVGKGAHGTEDVPARLDAAPSRPGTRHFYAGPVGADPGIAEIILDQVREAGAVGDG